MRKLILTMQISLDGYVEGPNGEMDWFATDSKEAWEDLFRELESVDECLMGRVMYPGYAGYWGDVLAKPAEHPPEHVEYARWAERTPHRVFSRTLQRAEWGRSTIVRGEFAAEVRAMKQRAGKDLVAWGGARFAASLVDGGLVDVYRLVVNPVLLGGGKALFANATHGRKLRLDETRAFPTGAVVLRYTNA